MDYINANKLAWEEAYENRKEGFDADDIVSGIQSDPMRYLEPELSSALSKVITKESILAQFCCNNGRELLSAMQFGAKEGYGFDIAENMIDTARKAANKLEAACEFIATNIYEIGAEYENRFDVMLITIGALTWFEDLDRFFSIASRCLRKKGCVLIHDSHPVTNMIAIEGEDGYDASLPNLLVHDYFKTEPWVGSGTAQYMTKKESTRISYCYSHTFSEIIRALSSNGLFVRSLQEFPKDLAELFDSLNNRGIPLSYLLQADKI